MRAADSALPLQRAGDFADAIAEDLDQVKKLADQKRDEAETQSKLLSDRAFQLAADPMKSSGVPSALTRVPHIEFAALDDAVDHLKRSARAYDDALLKNGANLDVLRLAHLQALMLTIDQTLAPDVGTAGTDLVQESCVCARAILRLRCENPARRARGHRRSALGGRRSLREAHRRRAQRLQRSPRSGDCCAQLADRVTAAHRALTWP
jgi:hypothetical protein